MLVIVATPVRLESTSSPGRSTSTGGGCVARTSATCCGSRPALRSPFCKARSARSVDNRSESGRVAWLLPRGQGSAVGEHGDIGVLVDDGPFGSRVVGRRRHVQLDADGGAELLDRFHPLCRGGAGDDDPLRIVALRRQGWRSR